MAQEAPKSSDTTFPVPTPPPSTTTPTPAPTTTPVPASDLKTSARTIANEAQSAATKQSESIKAKFLGTVEGALGAARSGVGQYADKAQEYLQQCHSTDSTATSTAPIPTTPAPATSTSPTTTPAPPVAGKELGSGSDGGVIVD